MDDPKSKSLTVVLAKSAKVARRRRSRNETVWGRGYVLRDAALPRVASPSLAPEMRDMIDDPPTGFVSRKSFSEYRARISRRQNQSAVDRAGSGAK